MLMRYTNIKIHLSNNEVVTGKVNTSKDDIRNIISNQNTDLKVILIEGNDNKLLCIPIDKVIYFEYY